MTKPTAKSKKSATTIVYAMAKNRHDYKESVIHHIEGALLEYYKVKLATRNGFTGWVAHWQTEVNMLLGRVLSVAVLRSIRGFKDRRKAIYEAIAETKAADSSFRSTATNTILDDYRVRKLKYPLLPGDEKDFWIQVDRTINNALDGYHDMTDLHETLWSICRDKSSYQENGSILPDCSCSCKFFQKLAGDVGYDWGVCSNAKSLRSGLLTFEHMGCEHFESETRDKDSRT